MQVIILQVSKSLYQHFVISVLAKLLNYVWLFEILMTVALQVPRSMGFPRQEYWSRLPFPSQEILVNPGMEPVSPASSMLQTNYFPSEPPGSHRLLAMKFPWHHICPYKFQHRLSSHSVNSSKVLRFLRPKRSGDINSGNHLPSPHL